MRLIFITRKIDRGDALTGFVFTWIEKLAAKLEKLYVICQEKGDASGLPRNVEVYSFGKERGYGRFRQFFSLFALSFTLGKKADGFFVHMHPVYAITAALPTKILGKKMVLWYTHKAVDFKLRVAHALAGRVLTASRESFRLPSRKVKVVGHGIDLEKFTPTSSPPISRSETGGEREGVKFRIVSIGRISPVKDYETLIKAAEILRGEGFKNFEINIYGRIGLPEHQTYLDSLVEFVHNADLEGVVKFQGELNYDYVDEVYHEADLFVNLSQTGSIDKSVLEASASETLVASSNEAFQKPLAAISPLLAFARDNPQDLAAKILSLQSLPPAKQKSLSEALRAWVMREHNLETLVKKIVGEFR